MPQSRSSGFSGGGFSGGGAMSSGDRTGRSDTSGVVRAPVKKPVGSVVSAPRIDPIEATPAPPEVAPAAPEAATMSAMVDPYVSAADTARKSANAFKADTPDHSMFNDAWDHAVHNKARPEMLDRSNPAWLTGVTNGLQYRRYNPRKVVAD